ncbi:MAG: hypothetical protein KIT58_17515 [Planctomycetota bacterium]|nr:hypothetical protein [Planctomycetota bacterium]
MTRLLPLLLTLALAGCASERVLVPDAPPPERREEPTPSPGGHAVWFSGHWAWDPAKRLYYWEAGRWDRERPGELWIPGYWERVEEDGKVLGWAWVEPRWERSAAARR